MKKSECMKQYGEEAWKRRLEQGREYNKAHREEAKEYNRNYREQHPEETAARSQELSRKGGKYYDRHQEYQHTGVQGARTKIRNRHGNQYKPFKDIIAPTSQIHHEWVPESAEYRGVALVEKDQHQYGIIDVIEILDGKITLLTEEEVKRGKKREKESLQA